MKDELTTESAGNESAGLTGTRRELLLEGAALLSAGVAAGVLPTESATAQSKKPAAAASLYERLGGIFAIAAVVDYFSDELIKDPIAGAQSPNPQLRHWSTMQLDRLPGLKFERTLWVADISGGPFRFVPTRPGRTHLGLENAHRKLKISPKEFDATAAVLSRSLDHFHVPAREKGEVLAAFAAHKNEVTEGYRQAGGKR